MQFKVRPLFKLLIDVAQDSRQKFNLTVSAETLVYKQVARIGKSSNGHLRSGGGLLEIMDQIFGPIIDFRFSLNLKAHVCVSPYEMWPNFVAEFWVLTWEWSGS